MLRFGKISEIDPAKGLARVQFDADDIVSGWLPFSVPASLDNKYMSLPDVNTQVWAIMDENAENGVIGGAIYSADVTPVDGGADITAVQFSDETRVQYDRASHTLTVDVSGIVLTIDTAQIKALAGAAEVTVKEAGITIKNENESLKTILTDLIDAILQETHPTGTGPSGPPINAAAYTAIKQRLPNLFEN